MTKEEQSEWLRKRQEAEQELLRQQTEAGNTWTLDNELDARKELGLPCYCGKRNPDHEGDCVRG